jgi:hypothetical protein
MAGSCHFVVSRSSLAQPLGSRPSSVRIERVEPTSSSSSRRPTSRRLALAIPASRRDPPPSASTAPSPICSSVARAQREKQRLSYAPVNASWLAGRPHGRSAHWHAHRPAADLPSRHRVQLPALEHDGSLAVRLIGDIDRSNEGQHQGRLSCALLLRANILDASIGARTAELPSCCEPTYWTRV